jgi:integrase/recombinase XerD
MRLSAAKDVFLADRQSPKTASTYRSALDLFQTFLAERSSRPTKGNKTVDTLPADPECADLATEDVVAFLRWLPRDFARTHGREPSDSTRRTYSAAIARFYRWLRVQRHNTDLDLADLEARIQDLRGKRPARLPKVPETAVVDALCATARRLAGEASSEAERLRRKRDVALLELLRGSALRVSEAVSIRRSHLSSEGDQHWVEVLGKGKKERDVPITDSAWRAISDYLAELGVERQALSAPVPLFLRHDQPSQRRLLPISTTTARVIFAELGKAAGVDVPPTPHRFRAWCATHLLEQTGNLAFVQDFLGHAQADTTRIYAKVRSKQLFALHKAAFTTETRAES